MHPYIQNKQLSIVNTWVGLRTEHVSDICISMETIHTAPIISRYAVLHSLDFISLQLSKLYY